MSSEGGQRSDHSEQGRRTLRAGRASAVIDLDGGRLASLKVDDHELLVTEGERPTRWGSFPMIPWCGRLPFGNLEFDGERHQFPITSPPHANHGRTYLQPWSEAEPPSELGEQQGQPGHRLVITTDLVEPWPFGGTVTQTFELANSSFTVAARIDAAASAMPAMIGWHPWFRRQIDGADPLVLDFEASSVYAVDENAIPTGELADVPDGPWDACFVGLSDGPTITWPGFLELQVSSDYDHWVIYTEPAHAVCVEPQSGPPNQVHLDPVVVLPGGSMSGQMTFDWRRL